MKVKVKNKNNDKVVKEIESILLGDYLATGEWEKVEREEKKSAFSRMSSTEQENK